MSENNEGRTVASTEADAAPRDVARFRLQVALDNHTYLAAMEGIFLGKAVFWMVLSALLLTYVGWLGVLSVILAVAIYRTVKFVDIARSAGKIRTAIRSLDDGR